MGTVMMGKCHAQHHRGVMCARQRAPDTQVETLRSPAVATRKKCVSCYAAITTCHLHGLSEASAGQLQLGK